MKYFIDENLISLLFDVDDKDIIRLKYTEYLEDITKIINSIIKKYLLSIGYSNEQIDLFIKGGDDEELEEAIKVSDIGNEINSNVDLYIKGYFDLLMPALSDDERQRIMDYLTIEAENQEVEMELSNQLTKTIREYKSLILKAKKTPVNLGGNLTQLQPAPISS